MTTYKDMQKWEPWVNILRASKTTLKAMQKWMAVVSSARELNILKGIKSTTKELNLLSGFQGEVMSKDDIEVAPMVTGRAITATLYVSPDGKFSDGSTWAKAYTKIQDALDAASTDANDCTLILIAPHATYYDIDTTGDPTWTGNYEIRGSHRNWAKIQNDHASATSVLKFTGRVSIEDVTIDCGSGTNNGIIISGSSTKGARIRHTYLECESVTGAQTAIEISGGTEYILIEDVMVHGVIANTKGMLLNDVKLSDYHNMQFHDCLTGIQFTHADTDENRFKNLLFHTCTLALNIDAGNGQVFDDINFFDNTTDVDDEVGDHRWSNLHGEFDISVTPDNFTGVAVDTGDGADTWTAVLVTVYTDAGSAPFRLVGAHVDVGTSEWYRLQLTADNGSTYFDDLMFDANKREGSAAPSGTEHIFNKGTVIKGRSKSVSAGVDGLDVWLEVQTV